MGGSVGGGKSDSSSNQETGVWEGQAPFLEELYRRAGDLFSGQDFGKFKDMAGYITPYMGDIFGGAMGGYNNMLGGGSFGDTSDIRQKLLNSMGGRSNMGTMYESIVGGPGNTYIDPMVDAMKESSMDNLARMHSGTGLDAAALGQSGSSRHAMQNAMQSAQMNQDMLDREMGMRGGAYDTDLNWKMDIARQADQSNQMEQDRMMQMLYGSDANILNAMGFGGNMQNLGMGIMAPWMQAMQAPWNMMNQYAGVIGSPTIVGSGGSSGSSKNLGTSGSIKG